MGQKISIAIDIVERNHDLSQYIQGLEEQREKTGPSLRDGGEGAVFLP